MSKAFSISRHTAAMYSSLRKASWTFIFISKFVRTSMVEWQRRKPYWFGLRNFFTSRYRLSLRFTIFSNNLHMVLVNAIER